LAESISHIFGPFETPGVLRKKSIRKDKKSRGNELFDRDNVWISSDCSWDCCVARFTGRQPQRTTEYGRLTSPPNVSRVYDV